MELNVGLLLVLIIIKAQRKESCITKKYIPLQSIHLLSSVEALTASSSRISEGAQE